MLNAITAEQIHEVIDAIREVCAAGAKLQQVSMKYEQGGPLNPREHDTIFVTCKLTRSACSHCNGVESLAIRTECLAADLCEIDSAGKKLFAAYEVLAIILYNMDIAKG